MTEHIGEIRIFGGNFAPTGWAFCEGQLLSIADNDTLFALIGTTYGGDGQSTFALPDLRGRAVVHQGALGGGASYVIGQQGGNETITLTTNQISNHNHTLMAQTTAANSQMPTGNVLGTTRDPAYVSAASAGTVVNLDASAISPIGGNQPHDNMPPYLGLSYIISLFGIFPTQ